MSITDALRKAVSDSGLTAYAVAKLAEISPAVVTRWIKGDRDITLATADKIASGLGLRSEFRPQATR